MSPTDDLLDDSLAEACASLARYLQDHAEATPGQPAKALPTGAAAEATAAPRAAAIAPAPSALWQGLGRDLGLLGAAWPQARGGLARAGLPPMAVHAALLQTLGAALAAEPYVSSMVMGAGILQRQASPAHDALLARLADGRAVLAFAHGEPQGGHEREHVSAQLQREGDHYRLKGRKALVRCAPQATDLLVTARSLGGPRDPFGLSLVHLPCPTPGLRMRAYALRDGTSAAELVFDDVSVPREALVGPLGQALPLIEQALDEATLATCAEALGVMQRLLRDSLDYARARRQFGVAIASFQALQHRLADMHMALQQASALTLSVAARLDAATPVQRALAVSSTQITVARACKVVGQGAVQIHGGMGMTEELAVGRYFRRATLMESQFGPPAWHLRRVARLRQGVAA